MLILLLAVLLLIPEGLVFWLVNNRKQYFDEASSSIADSWGREQVLCSPYLIFPKETTDSKGRIEQSTWCFFPDSLSVEAEVHSEVRQRGIFKCMLYETDVVMEGFFSDIPREVLSMSGESVLKLERGHIALSIGDPLGLNSELRMQVMGDQALPLTPIDLEDAQQEGHTVFSVPLRSFKVLEQNPDKGFRFSCRFQLRGSQGVYFAGAGAKMQAKLKVDYPNVSYVGRRLPDTKLEQDGGWEAEWKLYNAGLVAGQGGGGNFERVSTLMKASSSSSSTYWGRDDYSDAYWFGAKLLSTHDIYSHVLRSVKYAILVIALTFLAFFFMDALMKYDFPLVCYLLTGLALILFYLLLLSFAEVVGFGWAYFISGVGIVGMVTLYVKGFVGNFKNALLIGLVLSVVYAMLYVILTLESFPLLVGSLLLFVILGLVMYFSQRLHW